MQNYIQMTDELGNVVSIGLQEALNNIERFNIEQAEIRSKLEAMYFQELRDFSCDFYKTWFFSSTELVKVIGLNKCIAYFEFFRSEIFITWPSEAMDFIEHFGTGATLEIFRGESPSLVAQGIQGVSWSMDRSIAAYYANRHNDGVLLAGSVAMKDVLIYLEEEREIVVRAANVKNVRQLT